MCTVFSSIQAVVIHSAGRILSGFNEATTLSVGDITFPVKAGPVTQQVLFSVVEDLGPYYLGLSLAARHESSTIHIPLNNKLPDRVWTS